MRTRGAGALAALAIGAVAAAGCGRSTEAMTVIDPGDGGRYAPAIDPAVFVPVIDNPYLPLAPGSRWVYELRSDDEVERTEGSWTAGVDGALPGIVMPARPEVGFAYRQEFAKGEAEDMGQVLRVGQRAAVPAGRYEEVVVTRDWNPLEPETIEEKYYAPGVGLVLETETAPDQGRAELIEYTKGTGT